VSNNLFVPFLLVLVLLLPRRTCESMSVEALVLSNRAVASTEAFKRQSVTSERWLRLLEVGVADVAAFLQERRQAGYTIIGGCRLAQFAYCAD
jgi:tRNA G18 (ribose-2'-O)-methylase SpoU